MKTRKTRILTRIMTKVRTNRKRLTHFGLPVLVLLLALSAVDEAQARIRVQATVRTPYMTVQVDNGPYGQARVHRAVLPVRHLEVRRVSARDRNVARRLSRFTGVPRPELVQLRREGNTWREIGRWLGVPRQVIRASLNGKSWRMFMDRHDHRRYCEIGGR